MHILAALQSASECSRDRSFRKSKLQNLRMAEVGYHVQCTSVACWDEKKSRDVLTTTHTLGEVGTCAVGVNNLPWSGDVCRSRTIGFSRMRKYAWSACTSGFSPETAGYVRSSLYRELLTDKEKLMPGVSRKMVSVLFTPPFARWFYDKRIDFDFLFAPLCMTSCAKTGTISVKRSF